MIDAIQLVISAQTRLIAALDERVPDNIVAATSDLAAAISLLKASQTHGVAAQAIAQLDHAARQSEAARTRVNILSDWNRQRIDRLAELRGVAPRLVYQRR